MAADERNRSVPEEVPTHGRIAAPRTTTPRDRRARPKKQYPPGPAGKVLIFRTLHGKVVPMWVDS
jgi:hypothetical protein